MRWAAWLLLPEWNTVDRGSLYIDGQLVLSGELTRVSSQDDLPICIACSQGNTLCPRARQSSTVDAGRQMNPCSWKLGEVPSAVFSWMLIDG